MRVSRIPVQKKASLVRPTLVQERLPSEKKLKLKVEEEEKNSDPMHVESRRPEKKKNEEKKGRKDQAMNTIA